MGRRGLQAGSELSTRDLLRGPARVRIYLAQDLQSKESIEWNANSVGVSFDF